MSKELYVASGRLCGWEEDLTTFIKGQSEEEALQKFTQWLRSHDEQSDEVFVNFFSSVDAYEENLVT